MRGTVPDEHSREDSYVGHWVRAHIGDRGVLDSQPQALQGDGRDTAVLLKGVEPSGSLVRRKSVESEEDSREKAKYTDSFVGKIVVSKAFELLTIGVIILNAMAIGWDIDFTARWGKPDNLYDTRGDPTLIAFAVLENLFAVYFTAEVTIRFLAYRDKRSCLSDRWFIFDATLVVLMVLETWVLPLLGNSGGVGQLGILRLLRLLRITRMAKLMRAFPQLMLIVKGIAAATKAVNMTFLLLLLITYTVAILFTSEYHQGTLTDEEVRERLALGEEDVDEMQIYEFFGSMGKSMLSLLVMGTILDDVTACTDAIRATKNMWMLLAFIMYILINSFTMMNMLVGILVEVMARIAEGEQQKTLEDGVRDSMMRVLSSIDEDNSQTVTKTEFARMRKSSAVMEELHLLGIKEKHFDQYIQLLFETDDESDTAPPSPLPSPGDLAQGASFASGASPTASRQGSARGEEKKIGFKELLDGLCRLRPGQSVRALDFASFRQKVMQSQGKVKEKIGQIEELAAQLGGAGANDGEGQAFKAAASGPTKIRANMFEELERTSSADIVNELQRRLGLPNLEETGVPLSMMDEELQSRVRTAEAFQSLGSPDDAAWSKQALPC